MDNVLLQEWNYGTTTDWVPFDAVSAEKSTIHSMILK